MSIFTHRHTVAFAETDMAGLVHFSNYFRWMEATEHAFFKSLNLPIIVKHQKYWEGCPRVRAQCDFKKPVRFQDVLEIELGIECLQPPAIEYSFRFYKEIDGKRKRVASGKMTTLFVRFALDSDFLESGTIPEAISNALRERSLVSV